LENMLISSVLSLCKVIPLLHVVASFCKINFIL
jgi:hypothetical protein